MAPKRRGTLYGGRILKGKRTARRPARQPSPDSSSDSSASTPNAMPGLSSTQVDTLAGRLITMGRQVDFEFFEREGFSIGFQLKEMGWDKICSLDVPTYPALVKEFYANLSRGDNGLISFVRGKRIHLTADILGNLLSIPVVGAVANYHSDRSSALSRLMGRQFAEFEEIKANQLTLELRLLHNICGRILFPKTGRFEYVSERDILLMDCILTNQPINLPGMIIGYMAEVSSKKKWSLPYGMILTTVFKSQGVIISDGEPMKTLRHTDYYSLATLHRMGFIKVNGRWERKGVVEERSADIEVSAPGPSERHPSPARRPPSPLPAQPPTHDQVHSSAQSSRFSNDQLEQLKELFALHEAKIQEKLDSHLMDIRQQIYSLEDKFRSIESILNSSSSAVVHDIRQIFNKIKDIGEDSDIYSSCNAELQARITNATAQVDKRMNDFMIIQETSLKEILDQLKRLLRI